MILSTPFSRQNKSHQSWTNGHFNHHHHNNNSNHYHHHGGSLRKPPPQQPAPEKPKEMIQVPQKSSVQMNGLNHKPINGVISNNFNRSQTLSRLEMNNNRNRLQARNNQQRNLSSLGHYPASQHRPIVSNGFNHSSNNSKSQIYAPASIASPSELAHYKSPISSTYHESQPMESQHYAATSCIVPPVAASESGRSGRESALGNLLGRFGGSLRRKTSRWTRISTSKKNSARSESPAYYSSSLNGNGGTTTPRKSTTPFNIPPYSSTPRQPPNSFVSTALDPEIYASGKKKVEAEEIYAEGLNAIDGNMQKRLIEYELNESLMIEGELRTVVMEQSKQQIGYQQLISSLINWINDELSQQRIIVKDLQDDLYDGQILGKLIEKLHQLKLDIVEVTQNETIQRYKLKTVLDTINRILTLQARWAKIKWTVDGIHSKNVIEIIYLLITLAIYYRAPIKLPNNVIVQVLVVQKKQGQLAKRSHQVQLTNSSQCPDFDCRNGYIATDFKSQNELRDAFDALFEFAPEKLIIVKKSLVNFANRHLNKINMSCLAKKATTTNHQSVDEDDFLDPEQFSDGLLLVFLISSLEDYFVPLGNLFTSPVELNQHELNGAVHKLNNGNNDTNNNQVQMPQTAIQPNSYTNTLPIHKLHNVNIAFQLIEEAGIEIRQIVRAEDVANGDLKSVLRVLYALFSRYKHI